MPGFTYTVQQTSPGVFTNCCCGCARAPLVINPWVGDATNNGRPIHAFGGRMLYTDEFSNSNTVYATAVAANTASSPATGQSAGRYSSTYVMFNNTINGLPNQFPGGATYANNTRTMTIRHAYEFPTVIDPRFVTSYPDFALWCGPMHIIGATANDGQLYLTHDVQLGQAYVVKLVSNGVSTAQYVFVNNCTNYPYSAATGGPPQAIGSFLTTIYSERAPSIPGPTWHYVTGTAKQLCGFYYNANTVLYQQALGPLLLPADLNYNNTAFWEAAYDTAVAAGTLQAGVIARGSNVTVTEWAEK